MAYRVFVKYTISFHRKRHAQQFHQQYFHAVSNRPSFLKTWYRFLHHFSIMRNIVLPIYWILPPQDDFIMRARLSGTAGQSLLVIETECQQRRIFLADHRWNVARACCATGSHRASEVFYYAKSSFTVTINAWDIHPPMPHWLSPRMPLTH